MSGGFENEGWAINVKIDSEHDLTVFAAKDDLAIQLQTGNMSRAPYDLLELQYIEISHEIEASATTVTSKSRGIGLGSNIAHPDRVRRKLFLFRDIFTVRILLLAFE